MNTKLTEMDFLQGICPKEVIGLDREAVWLESDRRQGLCRASQVGTLKQTTPTEPESTPEEIVAGLPPPTLAELKQAAVRVARDSCGSYDAFLQKYPAFHHRFLLAMVREAEPRPQRTDIRVEVSWLSPERLSYKNESPKPMVDEVIEVQPKLLSAVPEQPEEPWKESKDSKK